MKTQLSVLALSAIMIASLSTAPTYGQLMGDISQPITVSVDKPTYNEGDTIMISGAVARSGDGDVTIQIVGPDDSQNIAGVAQSTVNRDGTFEAEIKAGGTMNRDGTYTVKAQYGSSMTVEAVTTFEFLAADREDPEDPTEQPGVAANIGDDTITIEGTDDVISYEITGGKILSVVPNVDVNSLVIIIESTDDGVLTMTIPRTILESKDGEEDSDLFILIDGEEREFDVDTTETDRTVTIEFEYGAEMIEIIGTWVVPEFGVIAVMILAVAIVATIVISSRSRLSIMTPKM